MGVLISVPISKSPPNPFTVKYAVCCKYLSDLPLIKAGKFSWTAEAGADGPGGGRALASAPSGAPAQGLPRRQENAQHHRTCGPCTRFLPAWGTLFTFLLNLHKKFKFWWSPICQSFLWVFFASLRVTKISVRVSSFSSHIEVCDLLWIHFVCGGGLCSFFPPGPGSQPPPCWSSACRWPVGLRTHLPPVALWPWILNQKV